MEKKNIKNALFLDSSSLIRNTNPMFLQKNLSREAYFKNPILFSNRFNNLLSINKELETYYKEKLLKLLYHNIISHIITMDCTFYSYNTNQITNIFGHYNFDPNCIQNLCLFKQNLDFEIYKKCYFILRNSPIIIVDDFFSSIEIGKYLLSKTQNSSVIFLSDYSDGRYLSTSNALHALLNLFEIR